MRNAANLRLINPNIEIRKQIQNSNTRNPKKKACHLQCSDVCFGHLNESLEFYIEQKISTIEAEIFLIAKKYGVKDVFELDKRIEEGLVSENEAYDDYFHLDHLEAERRELKEVAENF